MIGESEGPLRLSDPEDVASGDGPENVASDDDGVGADREAGTVTTTARHKRRARWFTGSLAMWFLVIAVPVGTFLVFAVPAFQGLDEPNHFLRVWSVTDGTIGVPGTHWDQRSVDIGGRAVVPPGLIRRGLTSRGVVVDACLAKYISVNLASAARQGPMDASLSYGSPDRCASGPNVFELIPNTAVDSPVAYAPAVVAVAVLRLVGAPLPVIFYGARLFGLAVYLALMALAIRIAPRGRALLFVIALLPMSLYSMATINADALLLTASLLTVSLTIRCCVDERAGWGWFGALAATVWVVALCKEPYGLMALLVLLVPAARLSRRSLRGRELSVGWVNTIKVGVVAIAGVLSAGWWELGVRGSSWAALYPAHYINEHVQLYTLLHHPATAITTIFHSLENTPYQTFTVLSGFLEIGFFRDKPGSGSAPLVIGLVGVLALFVAYQVELAGGRFRSRLTTGGAVVRTAWLWLPTVLVVVFTTLLYFETFVLLTPPHIGLLDPLDNGVDGRYFLPWVAVPMVSVAMADRIGARRVPRGWLIAAAVAMSAYLVVKVLTRFW